MSIPSLRILLFDDDASLRATLRICVEAASHQCMEAKDGHDAQEWLEGHLVDLMVTDYQMPGITGLELIQWIKSHKKTKGLPIIFYSGQLTADLKARALHSGSSAVLEKPFSFQEFLLLISQVGGESLA